jgi:hypothetical protein
LSLFWSNVDFKEKFSEDELNRIFLEEYKITDDNIKRKDKIQNKDIQIKNKKDDLDKEKEIIKIINVEDIIVKIGSKINIIKLNK